MACGGRGSARGACGRSRKALSEWCAICLEPLHVVAVPGRCCLHTGAPGKDFPRSDEAWSLPRPHVSGKPLQSPASQAQVWGPRSGHQAYTDGPVRDLGVHTLAPQETLLLIGGIGGSGKSQEATYVASRKVGSSPTARPAESCSDSFWGL